MTERNRQMENRESLIVAPGDWPERIRGQLEGRFAGGGKQMVGCRDIYEAAAEILEAQGRGCGVLVYVLVDSMPEAEMQFFSCWSANEQVRTVALSLARRQGKLSLALARGADEAMILNGPRSAKSLTAAPPVAEESLPVAEESLPVAGAEDVREPVLVEDAAVELEETEKIEEVVLEDDEPGRSVLEDVEQAEPVRTAVTAGGEVAEPLLTDEELNALLS